MSSYVNFYLQKGDTKIRLLDMSRSTYVYSWFENAVPYGKTVELTDKIWAAVFEGADESIKAIEKSIRICDTAMDHSKDPDDIFELAGELEEHKESLDEALHWKSVLCMLKNELDYKDDDAIIVAGIEA